MDIPKKNHYFLLLSYYKVTIYIIEIKHTLTHPQGQRNHKTFLHNIFIKILNSPNNGHTIKGFLP